MNKKRSSDMIPQYQNLSSKNISIPIVIPFGKFAVGVVCLPLFSFIFCILWCLIFVFHASTATHCGVENYLPSISAAIGNYQPQRFVWQISILLHFLPRLLITRMYLNYYTEEIQRNYQKIVNIVLMINVIENFALLGLSLWTSVDDYEIHKFCFIAFIATSQTYMLLSYLLHKYKKRLKIQTQIEKTSLKYKFYLFLINITAFCLAGYCFVRHNSYCEPLVYTYFALFEFIVVFTNMGYHMTAYFDFFGKSLAFDWNNGFYLTHQ